MKTVKRTAEYTVLQRGDGRYAVRGKDRKWINGEAKVDILVKEKLMEKPKSKPQPEPEPEATEEAAAEGAADAGSTGDADGEPEDKA